ncbi:glycosyltransferase family 4 protein [Pelagibius litoralis]|uniref:Glycosyltransferase family 4 protein n=1 Tax=Pelagibius litoralis TaxID=374515 RepID=A0A967EYB1_9PROT|nr:glycosyltransferase family 4 protein [Pelagibius litoralis]NIA69678.1 glycosyltransferase family 4 protein [Pelagibius litoralis]
MRLVYVNADNGIPVFGNKGASVHIQEMARALTSLDCELRILTARKGSAPTGGLAELVEAVEGPDRVSTLTGRDEKERLYVETAHQIETRLIALHKFWPFDLIYERYSLWSSAGVRAARRLGITCIIEVNAPLVEEQAAYRKLALDEIARGIEAEVFAKADALMVVSRPLADYVHGRGAAPQRVHVTGNAVDGTRFHPGVVPADVPDIPKDAFVLGFSGSLKRWHGVDVLMTAFRNLKSRMPEAHLLIVGDGPKHGWIEGFAQGADLMDSVTMTGWQPHAALPGLIARMDVATAPYPQSDNHYFSPLKLFEYMAVGRPIIASRIGQTAEVIADGRNGVLVPPGDADALAEAVMILRCEPDIARRLAAAAAEEGRKHDWKRNARAVLDTARGARKVA